jgi:PAS domain S-box-containing protein
MTENMKHFIHVDGSKTSNCFFYLDATGQCAYVNEHCCEYMGYAREELISHAMDELGVITDCHCFMSMFRACMHDKTSRFATTVHRKDGVILPAEFHIMQSPRGRRMLLRCDLLGMGG